MAAPRMHRLYWRLHVPIFRRSRPLPLVLIDGLGALVLVISQYPAMGPGDVASDFKAFWWDILRAVGKVVARVLFRAHILKGVKFTVLVAENP